MKKIVSIVVLLGSLFLAEPAFAGCSGQFQANQFCGTGASPGIPGPVNATAAIIQAPGGTLIGNNTTNPALAAASALTNPVLGIPGTSVGSIAFGNLTSGTEKIQPATGALGSGVATLPAGTYNIVGDSLTQTLTNKTYNGLTVSTTTGTLTIANSKTLTVNNSLGFSGTDGTTFTFPSTSDTVVTLAASQTLSNKSFSSAVTITSNSANALAVGPNGTTNPGFSVDASTASSATGLNIKSAAAGAGVAVSVLSSGSNENLTIAAKGSGSIGLNSPSTITSTSANALAVGPAGTTNPTLEVDASTASAATGLDIKSAAAGSGIALSALSSGTNENLTLNAKGSGTITLANVSTGSIALNSPTAVTSSSANAFDVGLNGTTNPALQVDASTASSATGLAIKSFAAAGNVNMTVISSGTNEGLNVNAKGSGTINIGNVSTGTVAVGGGGGGLTVNSSFTATGLVTYADMATAAIATSAQVISAAANTLVPAANIYSSETTTTFGATTTFDFSTFINTAVTLTNNITTMTLSNVKAGQAGQIRFIQDGAGSHTTVWNSNFKFAGGATPTLSTAPNAIDVLFYSCISTSLCYASLTLNMK